MRFLTFLALCITAGALGASESVNGGLAYPGGYETASMLNGEFWTSASNDARLFYVRAAIETLSTSPRQKPRQSGVGWTHPQFVEWITGFYDADPTRRRLPVAFVLGYAVRASEGEGLEPLNRDAAIRLRILQELAPD